MTKQISLKISYAYFMKYLAQVYENSTSIWWIRYEEHTIVHMLRSI